jgi:hypothetical protein
LAAGADVADRDRQERIDARRKTDEDPGAEGRPRGDEEASGPRPVLGREERGETRDQTQGGGGLGEEGSAGQEHLRGERPQDHPEDRRRRTRDAETKGQERQSRQTRQDRHDPRLESQELTGREEQRMADGVLAVPFLGGEDHELLPEEIEVPAGRRRGDRPSSQGLGDEPVGMLVVHDGGVLQHEPADEGAPGEGDRARGEGHLPPPLDAATE